MSGQGAPSLFGTGGIRGTANVYPMTAEMALSLGQAVAHVFRGGGRGKHRILIGKDTRLSGDGFKLPDGLEHRIEEISSVCDTVQRVEKDLDGRGRVLIRYSGTEPKARVMVEGEDESRVDEYANEIAESLRRAVGKG